MPRWVRLPDPPKERVSLLRRSMGGRAKYLVDECLGELAAQVLRHLRHNVKYGPEVGLRTDEEVFACGWRERRVILTHDRDFLNDRRFPFSRNPGVIILPGAYGSDVPLRRALASVLGMFSAFANIWPNAKISIDAQNIWTVRTYHRARGRVEVETLNLARSGEAWSLEP